jgi:hypothetical protein
MAGLFQRIQNVLDDHLEIERQQARQEGYQRALFETRDALLATALAMKDQWQRDLVRDGPVAAKYAAKVEALNDAFSTLHGMEPRIDTRLDLGQIRAAAINGADLSRPGERPPARRRFSRYAWRRFRSRRATGLGHRKRQANAPEPATKPAKPSDSIPRSSDDWGCLVWDSNPYNTFQRVSRCPQRRRFRRALSLARALEDSARFLWIE